MVMSPFEGSPPLEACTVDAILGRIHMKSDLHNRSKKDYEKLSPPYCQVRYSIFYRNIILKQLARQILIPFRQSDLYSIEIISIYGCHGHKNFPASVNIIEDLPWYRGDST